MQDELDEKIDKFEVGMEAMQDFSNQAKFEWVKQKPDLVSMMKNLNKTHRQLARNISVFRDIMRLSGY